MNHYIAYDLGHTIWGFGNTSDEAMDSARTEIRDFGPDDVIEPDEGQADQAPEPEATTAAEESAATRKQLASIETRLEVIAKALEAKNPSVFDRDDE